MSQSKKAAEKRVCPDCGKELREGQHVYGVYRDVYKTEENKTGHLYVCGSCYIGN